MIAIKHEFSHDVTLHVFKLNKSLILLFNFEIKSSMSTLSRINFRKQTEFD